MYLKQNEDDQVVKTWENDTVYLLSYWLIFLQTNLNNAAVKESMKFTKERFVDGCMKTNELCQCFKREQIEAMYDKIKRFPYD